MLPRVKSGFLAMDTSSPMSDASISSAFAPVTTTTLSTELAVTAASVDFRRVASPKGRSIFGLPIRTDAPAARTMAQTPDTSGADDVLGKDRDLRQVLPRGRLDR